MRRLRRLLGCGPVRRGNRDRLRDFIGRWFRKRTWFGSQTGRYLRLADLGEFHLFLDLTVGRLLGPRYLTLPLMDALLNVVIICAFPPSLGAHGGAAVENEREDDDQTKG